jgi:hypothetical protein
MRLRCWGMRALWVFVALVFGGPLLVGPASVLIGPLVGAAVILGPILLLQLPMWWGAGVLQPRGESETAPGEIRRKGGQA